jgi:chromosome partitioning protein
MNLNCLQPLKTLVKQRKHCLCIAVLGLKGGPGKTTLSTNIAWAFHLLGLNVLVVDSDHPDQISASLWSANSDETNKVSCIQIADRVTLKNEIPKFKALYDVIIIDGRPNDNLMAAACIKIADVAIVPTLPTPLDMWRVRDMIEIIQVRQEAGADLKAAIVLNQTKKNSNSDKRTRTVINEMFDGFKVLESQLTALDAYQDDVGMGKGVLSRHDDDRAGFEFKMLMVELGSWLNE